MDALPWGDNSVTYFLPPFWKGVYSKMKELLPGGANSPLLEQSPFQKGMSEQENKQEVTKCIANVKNVSTRRSSGNMGKSLFGFSFFLLTYPVPFKDTF